LFEKIITTNSYVVTYLSIGLQVPGNGLRTVSTTKTCVYYSRKNTTKRCIHYSRKSRILICMCVHVSGTTQKMSTALNIYQREYKTFKYIFNE